MQGEHLLVEDYEEAEEQKALEVVRLSAVGLLGMPEDGEKKSGFASGEVTPSIVALGIEPTSPDRKKHHGKSKFLNAAANQEGEMTSHSGMSESLSLENSMKEIPETPANQVLSSGSGG